jgi:hypothetical protein
LVTRQLRASFPFFPREFGAIRHAFDAVWHWNSPGRRHLARRRTLSIRLGLSMSRSLAMSSRSTVKALLPIVYAPLTRVSLATPNLGCGAGIASESQSDRFLRARYRWCDGGRMVVDNSERI